jgi:hypothetical protein
LSRSRLGEVLAAVAGARAPVVVFDLDSTLFSTWPRSVAILNEFVAAYGHAHPEIARAAASVRVADERWSVIDVLRGLGVADEPSLEHLRRFWVDRFFTDAYLAHDPAAPGAVDYVRRVHDAGAHVYYLTGRHYDGMGEGTVRALTAAGFPLWRGRVHLHLKPRFDMPDRAFKEEAIADLRSLGGDIVATFENEPENANLFQESFPDATNFLLETVHSGRPVTPHPALVRVPDFRLTG